MINTIICMYITLMSPIIAGMLNMVWCNLNFCNKLKKPIDANRNFIDGKRIFGDNKTWKGIVGYIILNILSCVFCGLIYKITGLQKYSYIYMNNENTLKFNIVLGLLLGLAYSLFELPNSFLKRRLNIAPGKTSSGLKKVIFVFLDQADSVIGCTLVVCLFYNMSISLFLSYIILGACTHIIINILLYFLGLRKNML